MDTTTGSPKATTHHDACKEINEKILAALENGIVPWRKPWTAAEVPRNFYSDKQYHGINQMVLALAGYERNLFITFKQLKNIGGKVRRGEKGHLVCYWQKQQPKENTEGTEQKPKAFLKHYFVFNISQCEDIPEQFLPPERTSAVLPSCEAIVKGMPDCPKIVHKDQGAFYDIDGDYINMPKKKSFASDAAYYSTLFHEMVHSTGHSKRLNRPGVTEMAPFGGAVYSLEELVAEIGACYLQSLTGITGEFDQSTAYIQNWLNVLQNDRWFIFKACSDAQRALVHILNVREEGDTETEER